MGIVVDKEVPVTAFKSSLTGKQVSGAEKAAAQFQVLYEKGDEELRVINAQMVALELQREAQIRYLEGVQGSLDRLNAEAAQFRKMEETPDF